MEREFEQVTLLYTFFSASLTNRQNKLVCLSTTDIKNGILRVLLHSDAHRESKCALTGNVCREIG